MHLGPADIVSRAVEVAKGVFILIMVIPKVHQLVCGMDSGEQHIA